MIPNVRRQGIDIRIHAGAPATRAEDDRSKAQARAYMSLDDPSTHPDTTGISASRPLREDGRVRSPRPAPGQECKDRAQDIPASAFVEGTQLAFAAVDSQFLASILPSLQEARGLAEDASNSRSAASSIAAQSKCNRAQQDPDDGEDVSIEHARQTARSNDGTPLPKRYTPESGSARIQDTSQLPSSYSLTESDRLISDGITTIPEPSDRGADDQTRSSTEPGSGKEAVATNSGMPAKDRNLVSLPRAEEVERLSGLPTVIRPSGPAAALSTFTTHITDALRHLAESSPISQSYNPVFVTREIDIWERGHWLVPCSDWSYDVKMSFWRTLETVIGHGSAGWGVWCHRGWEENLENRGQSLPGLALDPSGFGPVKVYCWGEVVKHVYLLLYVASDSKVRRQGLQWVDADGTVVVQMRTAQSNRSISKS